MTAKAPIVHTFRHEYLCNQQAHCNQILSEALLGLESFGPDRIRTLVSMATDSSRVIMGKRCCHFFLAVFHPILFILAGTNDMQERLKIEIRRDLITDC